MRGNPDPKPPNRPGRRTGARVAHKSYAKDKELGTTLRKVARLDRRIETAQAARHELLCSDSEESKVEVVQRVSEADNRMAVRYFWLTLGKPTTDWKGAGGAVSIIRHRIGVTAPSARSCYATLERIVADEDDDLTSRLVTGRERQLTPEDDLFIGLIICEGHSQRSAAFLLNGDRIANGLEPVSRTAIREAEARVEVWRRKRRTQKSGSSDLDSPWSKASLALALQVQGQLRAGAELAKRPTVGPVVKLERKSVQCLPTDVWGLLDEPFRVPGSHWVGCPKHLLKHKFVCDLLGYANYKWSAKDIKPTYFVSVLEEGGTIYPIKASDIWSYLPKKQAAEITAILDARAAAPPPFVPEQLFVIDQHHKKCSLGKTSSFDCKMPIADDKWCAVDDGGEYPPWSDTTSVTLCAI